MKIKITYENGTTVELEGTEEECARNLPLVHHAALTWTRDPMSVSVPRTEGPALRGRTEP
jgi:hypothetical protein